MTKQVKQIIWLLLFAVASVLAFTIPGGEPIAAFIGKVLSTEKVSDISYPKGSDAPPRLSKEKVAAADKETLPHWELWKAEVKVQKVEWKTDVVTNLDHTVFIYYEVDWSTNSMTPNGPEVGHPPRLRLSANEIYKFLCCRPNSEMGETNGFHDYDHKRQQ